MLDLSEMRQDMMDRVTGIMNKANEYRSSFDAYAYLWLDDRNEFMRQFLLYNHVLTAEEIEAHAEEGVPENPPTLAQFKEQVRQLFGMNIKSEKISTSTFLLLRTIYRVNLHQYYKSGDIKREIYVTYGYGKTKQICAW